MSSVKVEEGFVMFKRKLEVGDKIICKGAKVEIKEILFQEACISEDVPEDRKYIDIEFEDTTGRYRHWKSYLDGGESRVQSRGN